MLAESESDRLVSCLRLITDACAGLLAADDVGHTQYSLIMSARHKTAVSRLFVYLLGREPTHAEYRATLGC